MTLSQVNQKELQDGVIQMRSAVRSTPQQLLKGLHLGSQQGRIFQKKHPTKSYRHIVICGVGGSAFPAELLKIVLTQRGILCSISRDYQLTYLHNLDAQTLIFACSFSGNTEETLSSFKDALRYKSDLISISAGGRLEQWAQQYQQTHIKLQRPSLDFQPRAATGLFLGTLIGFLDAIGVCSGEAQALSQSADALEKHLSDPNLEQQAQQLSEQLKGKIPVFYALNHYASALAQVAKIKVNENAKLPSFWGSIPEMNHNELIGYTQLNPLFCVVIFTDSQAPARLQTRVQKMQQTLIELGIQTLKIPVFEAQELITRLLSTLYLIDLISCELAIRANFNPNEVSLLETFKRKLGEFLGIDHV